MARPKTKTELTIAASEKYEKLIKMIEDMTERELAVQFDFAADEKKKEAHWRRDKNLRDILIHLYEWQQLLITWIEANRNGEKKSFLPEQYTWKTYGNMNIAFWKKHQNTSLQTAKDKLAESHAIVMRLIEEFSNEQLFSKGVYGWTGGTTLGSYFISVTSSHYEWAMKKLRAHKKIILRRI